ncbi:MAG: substrate-binding domain-containing protein [Acidimicrobiia bacterium]
MRSRAGIVIAVAAIFLGACAGQGNDRVVVAAGTTLVDSGFIELVAAAYETEIEGVDVAVVALSSAEAFAYADAGNADVAITHEPQQLATFLATHPRSVSYVPFASEFVLVGPSTSAGEAESVVEAFAQVAESGSPFVSRNDGSGTHAREQTIWAAVPYVPGAAEWYTRTGSGMASTLLIASQRSAVTLAERGAYLAVSGDLSLDEIPLENRSMLGNPYDLTVVDADEPLSMAFAEWMKGSDGRSAIEQANQQLFGTQVYRVP